MNKIANLLKEFKRQVEITAYILEHSDRFSEYEICDKFKISQSTFRRDVQTLKELNVDIKSIKRRVVIDVRTKHLNELLSLYIAISTQNNIRNLSQLRHIFKHKTLSIFVDILKAINEKKYLQIDYYHSGDEGKVRHVVEPIYLNPTHKSFYLIAYENGVLRFFRLEGIESTQRTTIRFNREIPQLADIYKHSWGVYSGGKEILAILEFERIKETDGYFKNRILAEEQKVIYSTNLIKVQLKVKLSLEFVAWVMGWGNKIKIISPNTLKQQVLENANGLLTIHNK